VSLNSSTWFGLLDLAAAYGWNPMGVALPEWLHGVSSAGSSLDLMEWERSDLGYTSLMGGLVVLEDAINLAEALDRAFIDYEPRHDRKFHRVSLSELLGVDWDRPSVGAIAAVADLSRMGPFFVQGARSTNGREPNSLA